MTLDAHDTRTLDAGDFVLLPATPGFTLTGVEPATPTFVDPHALPTPPHDAPARDEIRHGTQDGPPDVRMLGGHFALDSPDPTLLVSLLPAIVHVRGVERLATLVHLVREESSERRAGRELALARLVELLLIEALRSTRGEHTPPGLLRGLADTRLAPVLQQMHARIAHPWTATQLAKHAALSRSTFCERFTRTVGLPPMEYLQAWRMAVAKDLLRRQDTPIAEVAERTGYGSASSFSTAFARAVGVAPGAYAKAARSPLTSQVVPSVRRPR